MNPVIQSLVGGGTAPKPEFASGMIKIHGDVVEFKERGGKISRVYKISNISAATIVVRRTPWLLILGALALFFGSFVPFLFLFTGPPLLLVCAILFWYYITTDKYSLLILLNGGLNASTYIVSVDIDFLRKVAEVIRDIMNGGTQEGTVFINIDRQRINQIHISGNVMGGSVTAGDGNYIGEGEEEIEGEEAEGEVTAAKIDKTGS